MAGSTDSIAILTGHASFGPQQKIQHDLEKAGTLMTFPSILIGIVISSLCGAVFHLIKGGGLGRLLLYLVLAWIGFWLGHFIANRLGWSFLVYGPLQLGTALLGAAAILFLGHWLFQFEKKP